MAAVWAAGGAPAEARTILIDSSAKAPPPICATFSKDGKTLALLSGAGLQVIDATSGVTRKTVPSKETAYQCALSPDGRYFVAVNNGLVVFDLGSDKIVVNRQLVTGRFGRPGITATFTADGKQLIVISEGGYFSVGVGAGFPQTHTEPLVTAGPSTNSPASGPAYASFSPDAHHLLLAYRNDQIDLMDVSTPDKPVVETRLSARELGGTTLEYPTLAPDGQHFVGLVKDEVVAWSIPDAAALFRRPARDSLPRFVYVPSSRALVLNTEPGNVAIVVDALDGKEIRRLIGTASSPQAVFAPAGGKWVAIEQEIGTFGQTKDLHVVVTLDNWAGTRGAAAPPPFDVGAKEKTRTSSKPSGASAAQRP